MAGNMPHNTFREVNHIVKFNGDNYNEYKYEFLGMMEQLGLKNMLDDTDGDILTLPQRVTVPSIILIDS